MTHCTQYLPLRPPTVSDKDTRVLVALLRLTATGRQPLLSALAREAGLKETRGTTQQRVRRLRQLGLVTWEPRRQGTLRPTVAVVVGRWQP